MNVRIYNYPWTGAYLEPFQKTRKLKRYEISIRYRATLLRPVGELFCYPICIRSEDPMADTAKRVKKRFVSAYLAVVLALYTLAPLGVTVAWTGAHAAQSSAQSSQPAQTSQLQLSGKKPGGTADHSKFEILQQEFKSGPEVTKACLSCHTEAADQIHDSIHWKWEYTNPTTGQTLGKKSVINAFCGNVASNEPRCTSCHAGYGWTDVRKPPPSEPEAVDCLVCHAETAKYSKFPTKAGHPLYEPAPWKGKIKQPPNLSKAAMSVRNPQRENCGS
ncbi:MAG TPA: hypothetical protein DCS30_15865, partial [Rhizobiales bacterium]|nr:hypothetical protein [Hyphomicrobiales bacterium]